MTEFMTELTEFMTELTEFMTEFMTVLSYILFSKDIIKPLKNQTMLYVID